jgi:hypothetical protein
MMRPMKTYELGPARDVTALRPSIAELQRAQLHALKSGDRRRALAYGKLVERRVSEAQRRAAAA